MNQSLALQIPLQGDAATPAARAASLRYRPEVDGLRALAVLPVILFHAGFASFQGGFVGVDVFFVVSGYLITSLITVQQQADRFSLIEFYERRARRILPALFAVGFACIPAAWLWLRPSDLAAFGKSVAAVAGFSSNILFWRESGYFDTATELKPLIHTWSLAVEEQYYLLFPAFLIVMSKYARRFIGITLSGLAVISLALAQWAVVHAPQAAFFVLPTRAWELLLGALIGYFAVSQTRTLPVNRWISYSLGFAGLLMIGYSVVVFNGGLPFPSLYTLIPTVGTALVILFGTADTPVGRVLSARPLVLLGLVSYSAYLWHQPIFAFARLRSPNHLSGGVLLALAALAISLSFVSWRWIEQPLRDRRLITRRRIFIGAAIGNTALLVLGVSLALGAGHPARFPAGVVAAAEPARGDAAEYCAAPKPLAPSLGLCEFGDRAATSTVVLYGDSHADALLGALDSALRAHHLRGVRIYNYACQAIPGVIDSRTRAANLRDCPAANSRMLDWVRHHADYTVLALRWTFRLYPIPGTIDDLLFNNGEGGVEQGDQPHQNVVALSNGQLTTSGPAKAAAVTAFLTELTAASRRLVVVYPVPEAGWDVPRYMLARYLRDGLLPTSVTTSRAAFETRNRFVTTVLDRFDNPKLERVRPGWLLCNESQEQRCLAAVNGVPLYYDDDHLSRAGARMIGDAIVRAIGVDGL